MSTGTVMWLMVGCFLGAAVGSLILYLILERFLDWWWQT